MRCDNCGTGISGADIQNNEVIKFNLIINGNLNI